MIVLVVVLPSVGCNLLASQESRDIDPSHFSVRVNVCMIARRCCHSIAVIDFKPVKYDAVVASAIIVRDIAPEKHVATSSDSAKGEIESSKFFNKVILISPAC